MDLSGATKPIGRRRLKLVEIYSQKYYNTKVRADVKKAIAEQSLGLKQTLTVIKSLTEKAFAEEDETIKEEVQAEFEAQMDVRNEDGEGSEVTPMPAAQQQMLEFLPSIVRKFLGELAQKTGWSFSLFGGGPCPEEDGDIRTFSYHHGKTSVGHHFGDVQPDFKSQVIKPYIEFLNVVYPADVRARFTLQALAEDRDEDEDAHSELNNERVSQLDPDDLQQVLDGMELDLDNVDADSDTALLSDEDGIHVSVTNDGIEEPTALGQSGNETAIDVSPVTSYRTTSSVECPGSAGPSIAQINTLPPASNALGLDDIMPSHLPIAVSTVAPATTCIVPTPIYSASIAMQQGPRHAHPTAEQIQGYDARCWNQQSETPWTLSDHNGMLTEMTNIGLDNAYDINFDFTNFSYTEVLNAPLFPPLITATSHIDNPLVIQAPTASSMSAAPSTFLFPPNLPSSLPSLSVLSTSAAVLPVMEAPNSQGDTATGLGATSPAAQVSHEQQADAATSSVPPPMTAKQPNADSDASSHPKRQTKKPVRLDATPLWKQRVLPASGAKRVEKEKQQCAKENGPSEVGQKRQPTGQIAQRRGGRNKKART
ncbi:uncharacterized protein LAESUDRAFT_715460 [Laetiporus sulphureus 93-53]|uniref:Uncharacterized protein n=1 Tax=Laetiporus sulphureus 93-53 TaxID=1314785 RepID=A0A165DDW8_9APHY|nr:uncharacterized protein LAESUDRAFT_715460 [Laetiporus sulphureus 93-53]KZT04664.1 hypothetical protein LAESUDRAFT_715460 [Laetiporus sulphureus 93-53]